MTWSTSNKKIAKVSKTGRVTGLKIGTCTIKATAKDGSKSTATCKIRVVRQVTSIKLNRKTASVFVGSTFQLKRTIRPTTATIKSVKWESSDSDIASVDKKGNVVGESVGIAKITVTTNDGTNKSATCLVSVRDKVSATSIIAAESQVTIAVNTSANVKFTMNPANSTDKVSYVSDNPSVASVNAKGKIYGKSIGSATVYATTSSGQSATVDVKVVGLNRSSLTLRIYDKQTLWVNGINSNVKWYSQNPLIATVEGGKVVGRKVGTTTIYAVVDGTRISCKIRVTSLD